MNIHKFFIGRGIGLLILVVIGGIIAGFYALNDYIYKEKQGEDKIVEPYRATISGVQTCLPHKDTSGPQTLECATGMKADSGKYYALDFALSSQIPHEIQNGERFTASGVITPIEMLSADHWQKYNVEGIFSVTDSVQIEGKIEKPFFTWRYEKAESLNLDGIPETNIFLEVKYPNGEVSKKLIDTTPSSCNDLPESSPDSVPNSTNAQCYGAGLGYTFKIIKGEESYLVMRKKFEEGLPNYEPPTYQFEQVSEFPFSI